MASMTASAVPQNGSQRAMVSAALRGHWSKLQMLVEKGANLSSDAAMRAFTLAAAAQSVEVLQCFLLKGIDVDSWGVKKALLSAATTGDVLVLRCLVSNRADLTSWAAKQSLILAAEKEQMEVLRFLLRSGLELGPEIGDLVMETAASKNDVHVLQLLLDKMAQFHSSAGEAALASAARCRSWEALHFLVLAGVELESPSGQVALFAAAGSSNGFILRVLEEGGLDTSSERSQLTLRSARHRQRFDRRLRRKRLECDLDSFALKFGKIALRASRCAEEGRFLKALTAAVVPRPPSLRPTIETQDATSIEEAEGVAESAELRGGIEDEQLDMEEMRDSELDLDFFAPPLFTSAAPPHLPLPLPEQPAEQEELDPHVEDTAEANPKLEEAQPMERCDVRRYLDQLIVSALESCGAMDSDRPSMLAGTERRNKTPPAITSEPVTEADIKPHEVYEDLRVAASRGQQDQVLHLLRQRAVCQSASSAGSATASHLAAQNGHREVVEALLAAGHRAEKVEGFTPLHDAAQNGHVEILRLLLRSSPCRAQPPDAGALQIAARRGHVEVVRELLRAEAMPDTLDCGYSALHDASYAGHPSVVQLLLDHRASIQLRATDGATAVHLAVLGGSPETLKLLLEARGDALDAIGPQQITPIHLAVSGGHVQMLRSMVSKKPASLRNDAMMNL